MFFFRFVRKVTELAELFDVRHSVFIVGPAATGKSSIWSVLCKAYNLLGQKCVHEVMNPKAVTLIQLFFSVMKCKIEFQSKL
jgi:dynein heavy chain